MGALVPSGTSWARNDDALFFMFVRARIESMGPQMHENSAGRDLAQNHIFRIYASSTAIRCFRGTKRRRTIFHVHAGPH